MPQYKSNREGNASGKRDRSEFLSTVSVPIYPDTLGLGCMIMLIRLMNHILMIIILILLMMIILL